MNRTDLQRLSNVRLREAKTLFKAGEYSGAYYLAGYAVECALKACYAKGVKRCDFPSRDAKDILTHKLREIVKLAKLNNDLSQAERANPDSPLGWEVVCRWNEESRYSTWMRPDAEAILHAITRRKDGVLPWIKQRW